MELKEIQALIKFVSQNGVDEVEINRKDFKLHIKKNTTQVTAQVSAPAPAAPAAKADTAVESNNNLVEIKSPMVGTFYRSANPESPSFANVGDDVNPGKVVCIIEAMKLFNEIESEVKGKIVKVLVDNATPVEYDQPLFLVEPA